MDYKINISLIVAGALIVIAATLGYTIQVSSMMSVLASGYAGSIDLNTVPFFVSSGIGAFITLLGIIRPKKSEV
ncbi:hypothetical protein KZZ04_16700 [Pseudoalteromonas sp. CR1]|uniref:hypothetical protein n=1 Tax=Pseudoalteromonas sp. CR1 TaxID=2861964 RepID=UPI001C602395|nr:hypothetical protein [Pseudoalteromonas sp. CR1]MBW4967993.1 hypothetical protein [Pseudoalteromonas sp. CR1]